MECEAQATICSRDGSTLPSPTRAALVVPLVSGPPDHSYTQEQEVSSVECEAQATICSRASTNLPLPTWTPPQLPRTREPPSGTSPPSVGSVTLPPLLGHAGLSVPCMGNTAVPSLTSEPTGKMWYVYVDIVLKILQLIFACFHEQIQMFIVEQQKSFTVG